MSLANANRLIGELTAISRAVAAIGIRELSPEAWPKLALLVSPVLAVRLLGLGQAEPRDPGARQIMRHHSIPLQ